MDHASPGVAVIRPGRLDAQARAAYARAFDERTDTSGGLGSMEGALKDSSLFDVVQDGVTVARYALKSIQRENGREVYIVAAVGHAPGVDIVASVLPFIETQCADADRITVNTRRRGLVKKLAREGWTLDSYVLRKKPKK